MPLECANAPHGGRSATPRRISSPLDRMPGSVRTAAAGGPIRPSRCRSGPASGRRPGGSRYGVFARQAPPDVVSRRMPGGRIFAGIFSLPPGPLPGLDGRAWALRLRGRRGVKAACGSPRDGRAVPDPRADGGRPGRRGLGPAGPGGPSGRRRRGRRTRLSRTGRPFGCASGRRRALLRHDLAQCYPAGPAVSCGGAAERDAVFGAHAWAYTRRNPGYREAWGCQWQPKTAHFWQSKTAHFGPWPVPPSTMLGVSVPARRRHELSGDYRLTTPGAIGPWRRTRRSDAFRRRGPSGWTGRRRRRSRRCPRCRRR